MSNVDPSLLSDLAKLSALHEPIPVAFGIVDRNLRCLWANSALARIHGVSTADIVGKTVREALPLLWPKVEPLLIRALAGETIINQEVSGVASFGHADTTANHRYWISSFFPLNHEDKDVAAGFLVNDISEHRIAEHTFRLHTDLHAMLLRTNRAIHQCRHHDELYRELCKIAVETGHFCFACVSSPVGDQIKVVASAGDDRGYMDEVVISIADGDPLSEGPTGQAYKTGEWFVINDQQASPMTAMWHESARRAGFGAVAAFPLKERGNTVAIFSLYAEKPGFFTPELVDTLSEITPSLSFALDSFANEIEREIAYEEVLESELRARRFVANLDVGVLLQDAGGIVRFSNPCALAILGLGEDESQKFSFDGPRWQMIREDGSAFQVGSTPAAIATATKEPVGNVVVGIINQATGKRRWLRVSAMPNVSGAGSLLQVQITLVDISDRKRDEAQRQILTAAIEQSGETVVITDVHGHIQYVNPAFEKATGYTREEAIGANPRILNSGKHTAEYYKEMWDTIASGNVWYGQLTNRHKDGSLFTEEVNISPIFDANRNIVSYVAIKRDISKQLRLEAQFHQAQKMESVGRLAGGVAHDFNNLLTVINGYSELLMRSMAPDDPMLSSLQEILRAGKHSAALTKQLLAFSRRQVLAPTILDVNNVVIDAEKMLRRLIGEDITLTTTLSPEPCTVLADGGHLQQVIFNLAVNARDAMPQGGRLTIETNNMVHDESFTRSGFNIKAGEYTEISVTDTGTGMTAEVRENLFEPFFTTKGSGKGTGLGLAVVHGIIQQSGGHVDVTTELGKGTTFIIRLPRITAKDPIHVTPTVDPIPHGTETVLLVEDEVAVRMLTKDILDECGYEVLLADNLTEALEHVRSSPRKIRLLITDVIMPEMTGPALARQLTAAYPDIKVLFISGYTDDAISNAGILHNQVNFLQKPFTLVQLTNAVRNAIDQQ